MAEIQPSLFDIGPVDAEAARKHQQAQHDAELDAFLLKVLGPRGYKKQKQQDAEFEAKYQAIMQGHKLRPDLQAYVDAIKAKILATAKPFLFEECALLGIDCNATKRDIKNAYRRQARKLHPDTGGDAEAFKRVYAAYRRLLAATKE